MKYIQIIILLISILPLLQSCKNEPSDTDDRSEKEQVDTSAAQEVIEPSQSNIEPCQYMTKGMIANHFAVDTSQLEIGPRKGAGSKFGHSCIARWMKEKNLRGQKVGDYSHNYPGIAIQFNIWSDDSYPDHWAKNRVNAYLEKGIRVSGEPSVYEFTEVEGLGEEAGWCSELSQLTWHTGRVAYDIYHYNPESNEVRKDKAIALAKDLMRGM